MNTQNENPAPNAPQLSEAIVSKSSDGVSEDALTHGVYAKAIVAEGEEAEEFDGLHGSLVDELKPEGPSEEAIVVEVAQLHWVRRRLIRDFTHSKGVRSLSDTPLSGEPILTGTVQDLKAFAQRMKDAGLGDVLRTNDPKAELSPAKLQVLRAISRGPAAATNDFDTQCSDLERYLKLLAMIDGRLQKAMAHLVSYKEYKRQYCKEVRTA